MRKSAPVAFLAAGFLIFASLIVATPAHAEDEEESTSEVLEVGSNGKVETHLPKPFKPVKPAGEQKRKELEEKYGKQGKLSLPPLVIRPMRETDDVLEEEDSEDTDDDDAVSSSSSQTTAATDSKVSGAGAKVVGGQATSSSVTGSSVSGGISTAEKFIAVNPVSAGNAGVAGFTGVGRQVNPERNTAIDISNVNFTRKTPAEAFIQASQVGLYAMSLGAIALALVAVTRAIRRK